MIRISSSDAEVERFEPLRRTTDDVQLRPRAQIVLRAHRGRPHPDIARDTATGPRSVRRWLDVDDQGGLDALRPRKAQGAAPGLTAQPAPLLRRWAIDGPAEPGLDRAHWAHAELADHLLQVEGIRVRKSAMPAFRRGHEIRPDRPTDRVLRGEPAEQAVARVESAALKKGRTTATSSCRAGTRRGSRWRRLRAGRSA